MSLARTSDCRNAQAAPVVMAGCVTVPGTLVRWDGLGGIAHHIGIVALIAAIWPLVVEVPAVGGLLWLVWPKD